MKTIEFSYTDAKGNVSTRTLLVLSGPAAAYEGIDVSSMPTDEFASFLSAYSALQEEHIAKVQKLQAEYDLTYNYRRFLTERMSDIRVS